MKNVYPEGDGKPFESSKHRIIGFLLHAS
jgi:hypothetical protein